ncbi:MAG: hypothetical protein MJY56_02395 [Bacteroidales bacterium]|nr:hypothetical protein [Bacteroidales bacterium]
MKRIATILTILAAASLSMKAQLVERTYAATDKNVYVAGDDMWISVFTTDVSAGGVLSDFSSVAYLELLSPDGPAVTAKIGLTAGRGAGRLLLPKTLPSGNYKLIAYTAQNRNEVGFDPLFYSKTISVYNTFTNDRTKGTVLGEPVRKDAPAKAAEGLEFDGRTLRNMSGEEVSLCISIYNEDGLPVPDYSTVSDFVNAAPDASGITFDYKFVPEYEGEVIYAHTVGDTYESAHKYAFISFPGAIDGTYSSNIEEGGTVKFFTNNIYGETNLVTEIEGLPASSSTHLELDSPFLECKAGDVEPLVLGESLREDLERRSVSMQISRIFDADTLYRMMPKRENRIFGSIEPTSYILDDYTRFPSMSEVFTEFLAKVKVKKDRDNGSVNMYAFLMDSQRTGTIGNTPSLVTLDGVPVFDHAKLYNYDPLLVERIDVYQSTFYFGSKGYDGVINFVTYKKNLPGMVFDDNVRILDFEGALLPMALTGEKLKASKDCPNLRETIYFHPAVELGAEGEFTPAPAFPSYEGRFILKAEGLTKEGRPVSGRWIIENK